AAERPGRAVERHPCGVVRVGDERERARVLPERRAVARLEQLERLALREGRAAADDARERRRAGRAGEEVGVRGAVRQEEVDALVGGERAGGVQEGDRVLRLRREEEDEGRL